MMTTRDDPATNIEVCNHCGGAWFERDELAKMKDSELPDSRWMDFNLWTDVDALQFTWSQRACPVCNQPMAQLAYGETGVTIDACTQHHGIFLDKGEFEAILTALEGEILNMDAGDYLKETLHEGRELIGGQEGRHAEWKDFTTVFRLFGDRIMVENPTFARAMAAFALGSPK
jgi:Zn-finger nucleic acid-binding protein